MAAITRTAAGVACLDTTRSFIFSGTASEAISAGQAVGLHPTTGLLRLAKATTAILANLDGLAMQSVAAGQPVDYITKGPMSGSGWDLSAMFYGAPVYLSDTYGELDTAAGTVSRIVGVVKAANDYPTLTKFLEVDVAESDY